MKVLLNEAGYVESYALEGELLGAVECDSPEDITVFETHFAAFRIRDSALVLDKEHLDSMYEAETLNGYRLQREKDCFPIINRGELWYDRLTDQQREELQLWYQAWLDVTKTQTIPVKPEWLK
jgi:hypothetical protein|nr:MAG TPA: Protein of unknown function (DUF2977) [Caudoviricetes sp.]